MHAYVDTQTYANKIYKVLNIHGYDIEFDITLSFEMPIFE